MSVHRPDMTQKYTLRDYLSWNAWDTTVRYELIDGTPYLMTGPPIHHQRVVLNLAVVLAPYFRIHRCELIVSPMDLLLFGTEQDFDEKDVVQPDLFVICRGLSGKWVCGVPEWIIEVLSPSTARKDQVQKLALYQKAGVKEYWIVDPLTQYVRVFLLVEGAYRESAVYERKEVVRVSVLEGLEVPLGEIFLDDIAVI